MTVKILSDADRLGTRLVGRAPIALARRFYQITVSVVAEAHANTELRALEFGVLIHIHESPGIDQNTLAEKMALDRTSISAMVFHLEQQGLIERAVNDVDRRARELRLTAAGKRLHDRQLPRAIAAQDRILDVLAPAERRAFIDMLVRVIAANQSYVGPGAGRRNRSRRTAANARVRT